jgi:hypothetical protein
VTAAAVDGHTTRWPVAPFNDPARQLCLNVGDLSDNHWYQFAAGETAPHGCPADLLGKSGPK